MSTMFCALCSRPVEARRQIRAGTIALAVLTAGISLLAVPFYPKRCSICKSTAVSYSRPESAAGDPSRSRLEQLEQRLRVVEEDLEVAGADLVRLKEERDFYAKLLSEPSARGRPPADNRVPDRQR